MLHRFWRELNGNVVTGIEIDVNAQSSRLFVKVRIRMILVDAFCSLDLLILAEISGIEQRL